MYYYIVPSVIVTLSCHYIYKTYSPYKNAKYIKIIIEKNSTGVNLLNINNEEGKQLPKLINYKKYNHSDVLQLEKLIYNDLIKKSWPINIENKLCVGDYSLNLEPNGCLILFSSNFHNQVTCPNGNKIMYLSLLKNEDELTIKYLTDLFGDDYIIENHSFDRIKIAYTFARNNLDKNGFILLLSENNNITIPGGKRKPGESSYDCAIREFKEETQLNCPMKYIDFTYLKQSKMNIYLFEKNIII